MSRDEIDDQGDDYILNLNVPRNTCYLLRRKAATAEVAYLWLIDNTGGPDRLAGGTGASGSADRPTGPSGSRGRPGD
jgi:hypothetical protein